MAKKDKKRGADEAASAENARPQDDKAASKSEQYRNWFLLLGVFSGIAIGLAAGSILINRDSEKSYLENRQEVVIRQDALEKAFREKEKTIQEIQKNNSSRDKTMKSLQGEIDKGLKEERSYTDEKRIRVWREIDRINEEIKEQASRVLELEKREDANQSKDQRP